MPFVEFKAILDGGNTMEQCIAYTRRREKHFPSTSSAVIVKLYSMFNFENSVGELCKKVDLVQSNVCER